MDRTDSSTGIRLPGKLPGHGEPRRGRKLARSAGLVLGVFAVLVLATILVFAVRFRSLLDPATLADRLEPRIERAVNRPVTIDGASLRLWPRPAVKVKGVRIGNLGIFSETPLASADLVLLEPRLWPLLRREIVIDRVLVRAPRALLQVAEDGTTNFGDFVPERSDTPGGGGAGGVPGLSLDIRRVEVEDARIGYRDAQRSRSAQARGVELRLDLATKADEPIGISGTVDADTVTVRSARLPGGSIEVADAAFSWDGRITADLQTLELRQSELEAGAFSARLAGRVDSLGSPVRTLDLVLEATGLTVSDLVAQTESGLKPDGELELDLRVRGEAGPGASPEITGLATVHDGSLAAADGRPIASGLEMDARLESGVASVTAAGAVLDGQLRTTGTVTLDSLLPYRFDVQMQGELDRMLAALPRDATTAGPLPQIDGRVELDLQVSGEGTAADRRTIQGTATITDLRAETDRLRAPVRADRVPLRIEGEAVSWSEVPVRVGDNTGMTSGRIEHLLSSRASRRAKPELRTTIAFERLDLDEILPARSLESVGWGRLVTAHLGGRQIEGSAPDQLAASRGLARPVELPLTGSADLSAASMTWGGIEFTRLAGSARFDRQRIEVPELSFGAYGGTGSLAASLELGSGRVEPFGLRLQLEGVRAEDWLAVHTPLGRLLSGTMGLELELAGGLDSLLLPGGETLVGDGTVRVRDGTIALNPVTRSLASALGAADPTNGRLMSWISRFRIDGAAVYFQNGRFVFDRGEMDLSGSMGFNGALDLGLNMRPDADQVAAMSDQLLAGLPESTRRVLAAGRPVELGIRVGGRVGQPTVSLDRSGIDQGVEAATEAGRSEIERRGLDLLRRLTGAQGDTAGVPPAGAVDTVVSPESRP